MPSFGDLFLMIFFLLAAMFSLGYLLGKVFKWFYLWRLNHKDQRYKYPWD